MKFVNLLKRASWFIIQFLVANIVIYGMLFIYANKIEPNWIEVKNQPVYISGLSAEFEGFRIVQLSDLHGKIFFNNKLVNQVNQLDPDLVVITGDVFDQSDEIPIEYINTIFSGLTAKYGAFFVFGNNDCYLNKREVIKKMADVNIKTLLNERVSITLRGKSIDVIGVDDPYTQKANLKKPLQGRGSEPKILLVHTPEMVMEAAKNDIDLVLAGHTHGGQIMIPFIPRLVTNVSKGYEDYTSGLYEVGNTQMYVNRGLGENDIHLRFLSRPEITVITLHK